MICSIFLLNEIEASFINKIIFESLHMILFANSKSSSSSLFSTSSSSLFSSLEEIDSENKSLLLL